MRKKMKTFSTVLEEENAKEIIAYFDETVADYNVLKRTALHILRNNPDIEKNVLNALLQERFGITKRTANSAIIEVQGVIASALALISLNIEKLESRIVDKKKLIEKKKKEIAIILASRKTNTKRLAKLKLHIYNIYNSINRLEQKIKLFEKQLEDRKPNICFGGKKLIKKNKKVFMEHRDSQINYIGTASEVQRNQNFQFQYVKKGNFFVMKVRRDFGKWKEDRSHERFVYGKCYFKYGGADLRDALCGKCTPISTSIIKRNNRYYLYVTVTLTIESNTIVTRKEHGVIGIDFNKGFINICETDEKGNIVYNEKIKYPFGKSGVTKAELHKAIGIVKQRSIKTGKSIVAEDISLEKKKRKSKKAITATEKKKIKILHSMPYSIYLKILDDITFNSKIELIKANPAYTSKIAEQKFCSQMKLNIHDGAAYTIARRGLGIKDKFIAS
mgnify:CR=1 FL=1